MDIFRVNIVDFLRSFFPLQLVVAHFKHNLAGVLAWLLFFLIVTGNVGARFGLPILFFSPEYLGKVSYLSFGLLGFGFGGLMTAFNTYSYSKLGRRFPFLIFVKRPFLRFCMNNSIIPLTFFILYLAKMIGYQWREEYASVGIVIFYSASFILGILFFIVFSLLYFFPVSQRFRLVNLVTDEEGSYPFQAVFRKKEGSWYHRIFADADQRYLYFGRGFRMYLSRPVAHIDDKIVQKVLRRNRINTSLFEVMTVMLFVGLSLFPDYNIFELPAAMSIVLLVTLIFMMYSVLQTWLRKWTPFFFVLLIVWMNFLSRHSNYFSYRNYAYGLDYNSEKRPPYSILAIEQNVSDEADKNVSTSYVDYIRLLENWKKTTGESKPKLIIVNSSGGGLRSALWTFGVLQKLDQEFNGKLKKHIHVYTGASGGMIGAGYFRELCLRASKNEIKSIYSNEYYEKLGKDMLNKLAFSASTRDLFMRIQNFEYGGYTYPKDRGQAFEEQLHANTDYLMDHTLGYYEAYEKSATIPLMVVTPTIVNDGRRLIISSQSLCFLTANSFPVSALSKTNENIDYQTYFSTVNPQNIRFSSVLRSSATFPFVTPMVTLPTTPEVQLMDAGIRDNYGGKITMELLYHVQDWIKENTSGVVILQVRDTKKVLDNTTYRQVSLIDKLTLPFGNMYSNFPKTQDFDQEQLFKIGMQQFPFQIDVINFNLREKVNDQISLSWHLSTQEKSKIQQAFYSDLNQQAFRQLQRIMGKQ